MREGVQWTNLTRSEMAAALGQEGFEVSTTTVDRLLDEFGFGLRKPRKVKTMGECAGSRRSVQKDRGREETIPGCRPSCRLARYEKA